MPILSNNITPEQIQKNLEVINHEEGQQNSQQQNANEPQPNGNAGEANASGTPEKNANEPAGQQGEIKPEIKPQENNSLPKKEVTPAPTETSENDEEKRYRESSREAMIQLNRTNTLMQTVTEALSTQVTDEEVNGEVQKRFSTVDWEQMSSSEQELWKQNIHLQLQSQRQSEKISAVKTEFESENAYKTKVEEFTKTAKLNNTNPALNGRESDFLSYCMKKTHRGTDPEILAKAFAFEAPPIRKRQDVLNNNGGGGHITKSQQGGTQMKVDDVKFLMQKDPKQYQRLVREGVIKAEDIL